MNDFLQIFYKSIQIKPSRKFCDVWLEINYRSFFKKTADLFNKS